MKLSIIEKTFFCLVGTFWFIWGANWIGNALVHAEPLDKTAITISSSAEKPAEKAETASQPAAGTASGVGALLASADAGAGQKVFKKCKACHTADKGGKNRVGPNLWDIIGRAKAGKSGFKYSGALKGLGGVWSYQDLDAFLANPKGYAKGTKMGFSGLKKDGARAALIVYLRSLSDNPKPLP